MQKGYAVCIRSTALALFPVPSPSFSIPTSCAFWSFWQQASQVKPKPTERSWQGTGWLEANQGIQREHI